MRLYSGKSDCIREKVVLIVVVFKVGQSCIRRQKCFPGKPYCIRPNVLVKVVVFGQKFGTKWLC